jgi:uncharacterized membrane-anchored protein
MFTSKKMYNNVRKVWNIRNWFSPIIKGLGEGEVWRERNGLKSYETVPWIKTNPVLCSTGTVLKWQHKTIITGTSS